MYFGVHSRHTNVGYAHIRVAAAPDVDGVAHFVEKQYVQGPGEVVFLVESLEYHVVGCLLFGILEQFHCGRFVVEVLVVETLGLGMHAEFARKVALVVTERALALLDGEFGVEPLFDAVDMDLLHRT